MKSLLTFLALILTSSAIPNVSLEEVSADSTVFGYPKCLRKDKTCLIGGKNKCCDGYRCANRTGRSLGRCYAIHPKTGDATLITSAT
ncbi:Protein of unknown function [Pyronema omphalodes CBS 100304]|uniref:Uncharacterized protein n=1 Tax=Pyronema omphalodes (strain CBS 100304) TaxID=1076935 RepID=U4L418_PYROM|nr:Protein of unknown function [Pyronema omphalodes CBS 100304]